MNAALSTWLHPKYRGGSWFRIATTYVKLQKTKDSLNGHNKLSLNKYLKAHKQTNKQTNYAMQVQRHVRTQMCLSLQIWNNSDKYKKHSPFKNVIFAKPPKKMYDYMEHKF